MLRIVANITFFIALSFELESNTQDTMQRVSLRQIIIRSISCWTLQSYCMQAPIAARRMKTSNLLFTLMFDYLATKYISM